MSAWAQVSFQDPISKVMFDVISFYHSVSMVAALVLSLTFYMMVFVMRSQLIDRHTVACDFLEGLWTLIPIALLFLLAYPSMALLYVTDEMVYPQMTLKVIGHQWYWEYEYTRFDGSLVAINSYMKPTESLLNGEYRLLEVDNCVVLPTNVMVRILVSSFDVIHSWCIPSMGVKLDAVPGRLNGAGMCVDLSGAMYGQCSELCGSDHAFMPIVVEFVELEDYIAWLG